MEVQKFDSDIYDVSDFSLINVTKRDTLFIKSEFKGGVDNADDYNMNLFYTIAEENKSVIGFRKSELKFKGFDWFVNYNKDNLNKITFDRNFDNFIIDDIRVRKINAIILK